jgi:hypothetical protein
MSQAALEAAARVGLLKPESTVIDRQATTKRIIDFLSQQPAADLFGVETVAKSIEEITTEIFHSDEDDLRALVALLCSLRAAGQVQHSLNGDGRMLCGKRTSIRLSLPDGSSVAHSLSQRFISSDHDVVTQYLLNQKLGSLSRAAKEADKIMSLTLKRIPALASRLQQFRLQSTLEVRALLMPETDAP